MTKLSSNLRILLYIGWFTCLACFSCKEEEVNKGGLFERLDESVTGISFRNNLEYTEDFNPYTYRNFYNGGGVALGDINNDGWIDVYFTGNIVDNKLYLNKGNFQFEDITEKAGVACADVWSSGATFADINGDGLLDLYVCKAGKPGGERRHNELFINNGDLTFTEMSKSYGLDVTGLSIQASFFDYDKDGDLDCYLLNNSIRSVGGFDFQKGLRNIPDPEGNKFFRNDDGRFVDISLDAGIYTSNIGYGLGITLSDFNLDGWTDLFISNDFFERDYLYLNNQKGGFEEVADKAFHALSMGSMGADAADLDNDLLPDLFVTEMLPESLPRKKTKAQYETWDKYQLAIDNDYHYQFPRNVLQRNLNGRDFVELGRLSGVSATEWSWASLMQDFDNNGYKDIFISNGIYKDLLDRDYLNFFANETMIRSMIKDQKEVIKTLVDSIPSKAVNNKMYRNTGAFQWEDVTVDWGFGEATFSNGSAYGDLDNDGDLDILVNNVNMPAYIYRNTTDTSVYKSIQVDLKGGQKNTKAIGAKLVAQVGSQKMVVDNYPSRGFESSIDSRLHLGLGSVDQIDSMWIYWNDGTISTRTKVRANQRLAISKKDEERSLGVNNNNRSSAKIQSLAMIHQEPDLNQFNRERLLLKMNGFKGPAIAVADVNGDGLDDFFFGNGKNKASGLFLSNEEGDFKERSYFFRDEYRSEVVGARFFDSDNDGDLDLYVAHGGKAFSIYAKELNDVLYINDGEGNFSLKEEALTFPYPISTGDIEIVDLDNDGKLDIVVGEHMKTNLYGLPGSCIRLMNRGGNVYTPLLSDALNEVGMITSVETLDLNGDGWQDIILGGEWMPIQVFFNSQGEFTNEIPLLTLPQSEGLWHTLKTVDIDNDGDLDVLSGNIGLNNYYQSGMKMYIQDFDQNASYEQIVCVQEGGDYFPVHDIDDLKAQMPQIRKKYTYYRDFSKASMQDLFDQQVLEEAKVLSLEETESILWINEDGNLVRQALPREAQYSSIHSFFVDEEDSDNLTIYMGGNDYRIKPQFGRLDASTAWKTTSMEREGNLFFTPFEPLGIKGEIRSIQSVNGRLLFGMNNDSIKTLKIYDDKE